MRVSHRRHNTFTEQNGAAKQRAVGLFFGRNEDVRARSDVALLRRNNRDDRHIRWDGDFLFAAFIGYGYGIPANALDFIGDSGIGHHAGWAEIPWIMTLAEPAETFRENHNFKRLQRAVGLRYSRRTNEGALLDVLPRRFHNCQRRVFILQTHGDIFPILGMHHEFLTVETDNRSTDTHGSSLCPSWRGA